MNTTEDEESDGEAIECDTMILQARSDILKYSDDNGYHYAPVLEI